MNRFHISTTILVLILMVWVQFPGISLAHGHYLDEGNC